MSLDHFLLRFWALLLLLVRSVVDSFDHAAVAKWFILLLNPPTTEQKGPLAQRHTIWCSSWALNYLAMREQLGIFRLEETTLGLVSAAWIFIWISRQLSSSKDDSGHLTTRSLIVNPSPNREPVNASKKGCPPLPGSRKETVNVSFSPNRSKKSYL